MGNCLQYYSLIVTIDWVWRSGGYESTKAVMVTMSKTADARGLRAWREHKKRAVFLLGRLHGFPER